MNFYLETPRYSIFVAYPIVPLCIFTEAFTRNYPNVDRSHIKMLMELQIKSP